MSEIKKSVISFKSANGTDTVIAYYYVCPAVVPRAILQISHGMCEYIDRYADFAAFMAKNGFVVCGNDHLGHGATSSGENGIDGYFAEKNGGEFILKDLYTMNTLARKAYPQLPLFLLGHSMGSFFAREYAARYPDTLHAALFVGTGGPNPMAGFGMMLSALVSRWKGSTFRSDFLQKMAFGQYLKKIEAPKTQSDWITRDEEIVEKYVHDPKCTFVFTASAFHELLWILKTVNCPQWAKRLDKQLPILLVSGDADPVGDYGKGVAKVFDLLKSAGCNDVSMKLYPGARHEVLNEINRSAVYKDLLEWCCGHLDAKE